MHNMFLVLLGIYWEVESQVTPCLTFWGTANLFLELAAPLYSH